MSDKLPAFQFYPGDWRKDPGVQALDYEYRGIWIEILMLMHESDQRGKLLLNGKPMPEDALARLLGLDKQKTTKAITTLLDFGVAFIDPETNALMSKRMVRDEKIRQKRRQCGKMGGNPKLVNQNPSKKNKEVNHSDNQSVNQNPTPSSSTSVKEKKIPKKRKISREAVDRIYAAYPRKVGPKKAKKKIELAIKEVGFDYLLERVGLFSRCVEGKEKEFIPYPATWFNEGRYNDDESEWTEWKKSKQQDEPVIDGGEW